ncbi:MAG: cation:proton antiporter [Salinisphaeraceae bacterium]|nr:cation:proton antiporter [Salinisphaeraceae bacterium]
MQEASQLTSAAFYMDPIMIHLVSAAVVVLVIGFVLRRLRQPALVGYILAGILLGPDVLAVFTDLDVLNQMGSVGVVLLLFFVGLEASPRDFLQNWRVAVLGTSVQVLLSVAGVTLVGLLLGWNWPQILLIGFVISLSCTAVVVNYLRDRNEQNTRVGQDTLSILITQDVYVIPMLIVIGMLSGGAPSLSMISLQLAGGALVVAFTVWLVVSNNIRIPFARLIGNEPELQFFAAFLVCFGMAALTGMFLLSTALGAFVAGMYVGQARETEWAKTHLESFRVVFVAIFFASIGMLIDLDFTMESWLVIVGLVLFVLLANTVINCMIFLSLGRPLRESIFAGALLAHVGEFSFVLAAIGWQTGILADRGYQLIVSVIALSLLIAPAWASVCRRIMLGLDVPDRA